MRHVNRILAATAVAVLTGAMVVSAAGPAFGDANNGNTGNDGTTSVPQGFIDECEDSLGGAYVDRATAGSYCVAELGSREVTEISNVEWGDWEGVGGSSNWKLEADGDKTTYTVTESQVWKFHSGGRPGPRWTNQGVQEVISDLVTETGVKVGQCMYNASTTNYHSSGALKGAGELEDADCAAMGPPPIGD